MDMGIVLGSMYAVLFHVGSQSVQVPEASSMCVNRVLCWLPSALYCLYVCTVHASVCLTWEDVNISVLHHIGLESSIANTLWSLSDALHTSEGMCNVQSELYNVS